MQHYACVYTYGQDSSYFVVIVVIVAVVIVAVVIVAVVIVVEVVIGVDFVVIVSVVCRCFSCCRFNFFHELRRFS